MIDPHDPDVQRRNLLFGLVLLAGTARRLLGTVTAFTLGHSVTLTLASLGLVDLPGRLIEVAIAASVLVLAAELARPPAPTFVRRRPWTMAVAFGLLHGLGFAAALREAGLPAGEVPLALLASLTACDASKDDTAPGDTGPDPEGDLDGDGHSNADEEAGGSDPRDPADVPYAGGWRKDACRDDVTATGNGVGEVAEDFAIPDQFGDTFHLWDFCDHVVLVDPAHPLAPVAERPARA